jgi:hypothetical protein
MLRASANRAPPSRLGRMLRASAIARPTLGGTMSERASLFAKSDDDVGHPRAMREQQDQTKL